ncbi:MAG: 4Fe-4S dicluster domain-containing protein [Thermodesulfobacteriota bacterium]
MSFRLTVQLINLFLFLFLLGAAISIGSTAFPVDLYLRMDPALVLFTVLSARVFLLAFIPSLIVLAAALILGRVFCSHFCPMGTTLELIGKVRLWGKKRKGLPTYLSRIKYLLLGFLLGGSFLGVSWVFIASPLSLITRFYGIFIYPLLSLAGESGLTVIRPLAEKIGWTGLVYSRIAVPVFSTQLFILSFFFALFILEGFFPRFWCRILCPAGAMLALFSRRPLIRRKVAGSCTDCGKCVRACPMSAIESESIKTIRFPECIVCSTCEKICPEKAISFPGTRVEKEPKAQNLYPERRQFLLAGAAGALTAVSGLTGLDGPKATGKVGKIDHDPMLRPPAALPEAEFLARCVRCGECLAACPTNTLQPVWFESGVMGLFSPKLTPRIGYCDPHCHQCALVCPTGAIAFLSAEERLWVKTGTAVIYKEKCLAWEQKKGCMVCDEVCPYKAVEFRFQEGNPVPVPEVHEERCSGCGYCEHFCPVKPEKAIIISPNGAIRLAKGSYIEAAKKLGLDLSLKQASQGVLPSDTKPLSPSRAPGFD